METLTSQKSCWPVYRGLQLFALWCGCSCLFGACGVEIIAFDPTWSPTKGEKVLSRDGMEGSRELWDGGLKREERGGLENRLPERGIVEFVKGEGLPKDARSVCLLAGPSILSLSAPLGPLTSSLLVARPGRAYAGESFRLVLPQGWSGAPESVHADAQGTFGFAISRNKLALSEGEKVYLISSSGLCLSFVPELTSKNEKLKDVDGVTGISCRVGETRSFVLNLRGKPKLLVVEMFSSEPALVSVLQASVVVSAGQPQVSLELKCLKKGMSYLLLGSSEITPYLFPVYIE